MVDRHIATTIKSHANAIGVVPPAIAGSFLNLVTRYRAAYYPSHGGYCFAFTCSYLITQHPAYYAADHRASTNTTTANAVIFTNGVDLFNHPVGRVAG